MTVRLFHGPGLTTQHFPAPRTYTEGVRIGQRTYGWGQFMVDCGSYVPTRNEQLLRTNSARLDMRLAMLENL